MTTLADAVAGIRMARAYTTDLLNHIPDEVWFRIPQAGVSHVAWQAGHLAVCQYALALKRTRGEKPDDAQLAPPELFTAFGKGSTPQTDAGLYPSVPELRSLLQRIHEQTLTELETMDDDFVAQPTGDPPHPMFRTKIGALQWSAQHEFLHAGQIGLLRRQLGEGWLR